MLKENIKETRKKTSCDKRILSTKHLVSIYLSHKLSCRFVAAVCIPC